MYTISIEAEGKTVSTKANILANPHYPTTAAEYAAFDEVMTGMENTVKEMHTMVNELFAKKQQLDQLIKSLPNGATKTNAEGLSKKLQAWDEDMIQRKATAYDDAENFLNKFTANYMFLMNQTESDIPSINKPNIDLLKLYTTQWQALKERGETLNKIEIPALNKQLFSEGIGAIRTN